MNNCNLCSHTRFYTKIYRTHKSLGFLSSSKIHLCTELLVFLEQKMRSALKFPFQSQSSPNSRISFDFYGKNRACSANARIPSSFLQLEIENHPTQNRRMLKSGSPKMEVTLSMSGHFIIKILADLGRRQIREKSERHKRVKGFYF